ncbi:hypothetical protein EG832_02745, partial [bacterium]|nr:hypothetical protein [bacterium]
MAKGISLKTQNLPAFSLFLGWCITLYILFLSSPPASLQSLNSIFASVTSKESLLVALGPIIILVVSGVLSPDIKAALVYWRLHHALPGNRAFSLHCKKDTRIDHTALEMRIGTFPTDPSEQNRLWYRLYKENIEKTTVITSHRSFLLARDLTGASALATIILPLSLILFTKNPWNSVGLLLILAIHYLVFALVAQNQGERFVCNVLA